jgi:ABC-type cobalamin/Fe3+-siderophores transport systems, ATPase components
MFIENLSFGYNKDVKTLHDISLEISGPGLVCILGPNGVGKSTLIKCMNKLLKPDTGRIVVDGQDISEIPNKELCMKLGYVPASSWDCFSMPVVDTVLIGRHNHQKWKNTKEDYDIVYRAMKLLGIDHLAMRSFNKLSAGQHQKVCIARGLVQETEALILDEPTANLDVKYQVYVTEMLRGLAEFNDMTIIMICHDLNIAATYAHKVILMADPGVIHKVGTPTEVLTKEIISNVYQVKCDVIIHDGHPHVILGHAISSE